MPNRFSWRLIVGDTSEILKDRITMIGDFVFIDGDHRIDTIRSDYRALMHSRCVVFDDYYAPDEKGLLPDISVYGCNQLVVEIGAKVLPKSDQCKPCGRAHLAIIEKTDDLSHIAAVV